MVYADFNSFLFVVIRIIWWNGYQWIRFSEKFAHLRLMWSNCEQLNGASNWTLNYLVSITPRDIIIHSVFVIIVMGFSLPHSLSIHITLYTFLMQISGKMRFKIELKEQKESERKQLRVWNCINIQSNLEKWIMS